MTEMTNGRNIYTVVVEKDSIEILPIGEMGAILGRNILIDGLQGLENKRVPLGSVEDLLVEGSINCLDKNKWRKKGDIFII